MPEEMRLWATIVPRIDLSSLRDAIKQGLQESTSVSLQGTGASPGTPSGGGGGVGGGGASGSVSGVFVAADATTSNELARDMAQTQYDLYRTSGQAYDIKKGLEGSNRSADEVIGMADEEQSALQAKRERQMGMVASGVQQLAGAGISLIKNTFGILQDIYNRLKASSPLLQSIEALFNLAMMLFFMPLGNKLAEVILPATLELVDAVVDMWDKFGDQSLPDMFNTAITEGVRIFGTYIENIGSILSEQGGLLGSIGDLILSIGDFIQDNGVQVLNSVIKIMDVTISHLGTIISLIGAFYGFYMGYTIAKDAMGIFSWLPGTTLFAGLAGGAMGALIGGAVGAGVANWVGLPFADGGHVEARPGGTPTIVGERGEGEWIIPDSKMGAIGGTTNYYSFYGFTSDDVIRMIRDETSSQISQSRLRGSF